MRPQYELRSMLLALTVVACGRIDVDLLPEAGNTDMVADAQVSPDGEAAGPPSDEAGAPIDDAGATPDDASATIDGAGAMLEDASALVQSDAGIAPIPPNMALDPDAAAGAMTDLDAALSDAAAADGSTPAQLDAATTDAAAPGQRDAGSDAATLSCAGRVVLGLCWYLGAQGASCNDVCSTHGGYDVSTAGCVGTSSQGGSLANCHLVLSALGTSSSVNAGMRSDSLGLGCHVWNDGQPWWLADPAATPDSAIAVARIACGCKR